MNKVITITSIIVFLLWGKVTLSQNSIEEDKNYQVGFTASLTTIFSKPQTVNLESDGAGVGFHGGVAFKYFFLKNNNIGITTGLFFDAESFKLDYLPNGVQDSAFYNYTDKEILQFKDGQSGSETVLLSYRKYKPIYLTVPVGMQFQTKLIGYFKYFGRFGINGSFLLNTKVNDQVANASTDLSTFSTAHELEDMNTKNELEFIKSSIFVGAGMNWFFSGNTCLHAEVQYNFGFTNVFKGESRSLYKSNFQPYSEKMTQDMLVLKVGVLF